MAVCSGVKSAAEKGSRHPTVLALAIVLLSGCSTEFAGTNFSGNSPGSAASSTGDAPQDPQGSATVGPAILDPNKSDNALPGNEDQCIRRPPGVTAVVDFEAPPSGNASGAQKNMVVTRSYWLSHGVAFSVSNGFDAVIRQTTRLGEPQPPSGEEAWLCVYCSGSPSRNRLVDSSAETSIGRYILSSTAAAANSSAILRIDYRIAVTSLSFDLIDVDGSEEWIVEALDGAGQVLPHLSKSLTESGYATGTTGNGAPISVQIATLDSARVIKGFQIRGAKPSQRFGFGFDNFQPGIPDCL